MPDPFDSLRQLQGTQNGVPMSEHGAARARARGRQIRRRRNLLQATGSVAAVAVVIGALSLGGDLISRSHDRALPIADVPALPSGLPLANGWTQSAREQATTEQSDALSFWICGKEATLRPGARSSTLGYRVSDDVRVRSVQRYATDEQAVQAVQDLTDAIRSCPADPAVGTAEFAWTVTAEASGEFKMVRLPTTANRKPDGARTTWIIATGNDVVLSDVQFRREEASAAESIAQADRADLDPLLRRLEQQ